MAAPKKKHASSAFVISAGFTVLSIKFHSSSAQHQLCVKEHRVRAEKNVDRPRDRTLFVLNIPPYCSQSAVKELFSQFGTVQSVELREKPGSPEAENNTLSKYFKPAEKKVGGVGRSQCPSNKNIQSSSSQCFKVGYIVFKKASSVAAAKAHPPDSPLIISSKEKPVQTGLQKWIYEYKQSFVKPEILQEAVDEFMNQYDKRKEKEAERLQKEAEQQQEDEEGWVKVTKGSKGVKARPHSEVANERALQREDKKKKRKELLNFYTWQRRDTQRENIAQLRKKFEEDKQRIALLRTQRKFRPY